MNTLSHSPLVMYLLHFEGQIDKRKHYIGSTTADRLAKRMHEHAAGRGSKTSKAITRAGYGFWLTRLWSISSRTEEHKRKRSGHYEYSCPICRYRQLPLKTENFWSPVEYDTDFQPTEWQLQIILKTKSSGPRAIQKQPVVSPTT